MTTNEPNNSKRFDLFRNPLSLIGIAIFALSTLVGVSMMFVDMCSAHSSPYSGLFTYLILPAVAGLGATIAFIGFFISRYRRKHRPDWAPMSLPQIDLNNKSHRAIVVGAFAAVLISVFLMAVTGYRSYQFSDSAEFCGLACHGVMKPEYIAYKNSPHARVACVDCHVGKGIGWFIQSKITGAYQIYSVTLKKYSRPIETPIKNLRPAQQTCEECHWPAKFFGAQQKNFTHYLSDEKNSPWKIQMLIKIGGGDPAVGEASGIHWHMNIKNKIEYISTDVKHETIPWVRSTDKEGHVTEYMSTESPLSSEEMPKYPVRRMDCVDCHNRPAHIFLPPSQSVDNAMAAGQMDPTIPYLKRESVRLLSEKYKTEAEALDAISKGLTDFYSKEYPAVLRDKGASLLQSTKALQAVFSRTIFPEMNTDWRAHKSFLTHWTSDGCFRCHDGAHKSREGKIIANDCNTCHTILGQGSPEKLISSPLNAQKFIHPVDIGVDVTQMKCSSCHGSDTGS